MHVSDQLHVITKQELDAVLKCTNWKEAVALREAYIIMTNSSTDG